MLRAKKSNESGLFLLSKKSIVDIVAVGVRRYMYSQWHKADANNAEKIMGTDLTDVP